jgi:hypothetical protein
LTIDLPDEEIKALAAKARAQGVSAEEYARLVLAHDLDVHVDEATRHTGADLVAVMQASPYREISLKPARGPLPVRDVTF